MEEQSITHMEDQIINILAERGRVRGLEIVELLPGPVKKRVNAILSLFYKGAIKKEGEYYYLPGDREVNYSDKSLNGPEGPRR